MSGKASLITIASIVLLGLFTIEESHCSPPKTHIAARSGCICYYIYDPVCASDGKTYGNACELNCVRRQRPEIFGLCYGECPCCKPTYQNQPIWYDEGPSWGWDSGWGWLRLTNGNSNSKVKPSDGISIRWKGAPIETNRTEELTKQFTESEILEVAEK